MSESSVVETSSPVIVSSQEVQKQEPEVKNTEDVHTDTTAEQESTEEVSSEDDNSSEDLTCVDENCKCHKKDKEESSSEEPNESSEDERGNIRVRVVERFQYFPEEVNTLAMIVLILHLLNVILQMSERSENRLECFKRPY